MNVIKLVLRVSGLLTILLVASCTWVKPNQDAINVELKSLDQVALCQRVGVATAQTKSSVSFYQRNRETVAKEVLILAKNEAVAMAGNTLVSMDELENGRQQFAVYSCN